MEIITLPNGFRICLDPKPYLRSCALGLFIASGSRFEPEPSLGVSHCIEHMLFKGTDKLSALEIAQIADDTGGSLNAYTSKEYTCLYARVLRGQVQTIFSVMAEMVLHPALREAELETEKSVIEEERKSYVDSSEDLCMESYYESFWPDDMLGRNVLGTQQTICAFTPDGIRRHMEAFYVPERMAAVFSGAFDRAEAIALCTEAFGAMADTGNPMTFSCPKPARFVRTVRKSFQQNILVLGMPGAALDDPQIHAITYACALLGGSASSRLFQRIREEMGLVYSIDAFHAAFLGAGTVCISMGLAAENEEKALRETLRLCREFPESITQQEFDRAKMQAVSGVTMSLESPSACASRIGRNVVLRGKVLEEDELLEKLQRITLEDVRQAASGFLVPDAFSLCVTGKTRAQKFYRQILDDYRG